MQKTPNSLYILIFTRFFLSSLLAGLLIFLDLGEKLTKHQTFLYIWVFVVLALTVLYLLVVRYKHFTTKTFKYFVYGQLIIDVLLVESLIILTGGIESWFSFLHILLTIGASMVLGRRAGYIIATFSAILYGLIIDLQFYGVIPVKYSPSYGATDFLYNIFVNITGLYLTAFLMGYLVARLEKTSESLLKKDIDLRELSRFHSEVIENIPSGLFTTDPSGRVILFNSAAEMITGVNREEASFKLINEIFPFLSIPLKQGRHQGEIIKGEEKRYIGMNISLYKNFEGKTEGYIGTFQDVTTIIKMEEEIKRKEKLAAIGELSASIAHELRNPLASIKSSFEMLKEDSLPDETRQRLMEIAIKEMDRLNSIVTDFLLYSNPKPPTVRTFNLSRLVHEVTEMVYNIKHSGAELIKEINEDIIIAADEQKIRQLIWNLLLNALDAIDKVDNGNILVRLYQRDDFCKILIKDNGCGINAEELDKIFYPFYSTKQKGTGLGLAIAYRIVEEHNGKIEVFSEKGKGTEFVISLPKGNINGFNEST